MNEWSWGGTMKIHNEKYDSPFSVAGVDLVAGGGLFLFLECI